MESSRRKLLAGIGGLAVGGGALLGSGAFTSVDAERDVEVSVLGDVADTETVPDVLIDVGRYTKIAVDGPNGLDTDGSSYTPTSSLGLGTESADAGSYTDRYVSLIENDVSLVFGYQTASTDERLSGNMSTTFGELITLVQETNNQSDPIDLAFGTDVGSSNLNENTVAFKDDSNGLPGSSSTDYPENVIVDADSDQTSSNGDSDVVATYDVKVDTGSVNEDVQNEFGIAVGSNTDVSNLF